MDITHANVPYWALAAHILKNEMMWSGIAPDLPSTQASFDRAIKGWEQNSDLKEILGHANEFLAGCQYDLPARLEGISNYVSSIRDPQLHRSLAYVGSCLKANSSCPVDLGLAGILLRRAENFSSTNI